MALPNLDELVQFYVQQGISASSHRTYATGVKRYEQFCTQFNIVNPYPVCQSTLCYYISFLASQGLAATSIKVYLSALRHKQIVLGLPDTGHATMPKLKLVTSGIARAKALAPKGPQRLPITPQILRQVKALWASKSTDPDTIMLWSACTTAFFGFFRLGEIMIESSSSFDPATHLTPNDVALDCRDSPSLIQIHLKSSKTDQMRQGISVFIGSTGDDLCPVAALAAYLAIRGQSQGPLFRFANLAPLTKDKFTSTIRKALESIGLDPTSYAGHSFRIGAATTAADKGIEDSTIKALGRWKSEAFQAYIKIPRARLASFAKVLSSTDCRATGQRPQQS